MKKYHIYDTTGADFSTFAATDAAAPKPAPAFSTTTTKA
jgi:hypothetical protein